MVFPFSFSAGFSAQYECAPFVNRGSAVEERAHGLPEGIARTIASL
jgi:hypothetical protein